MSFKNFRFKEVFNTAVIVAALGYFVDVYDLVLFLVIGKKSILDLGVNQDSLIKGFQHLLDIQMIGMLVGGIFWGILGDKKGRLSVLFGSIVMYSLANIANGFVSEITALGNGNLEVMQVYAILRFIAGFGLAGELGAGITLVSEIMSKETRGFGTMIVASVGVTGAIAAALVGKLGWQLAYFIGGGLGLSLLLLRIGVFESGMFKSLGEKKVSQGQFGFLFKTKERAFRYVNSILIGLPVWFVIGVLIARAPEISKILGVKSDVDQGLCVLLCYSGLVLGDILSGVISQIFQSRKKVLYLFYTMCGIFISIYLNLEGVSVTIFYSLIFLLGLSVGFWAVFITIASEQFGTNIRATVSTTVPNFIRGSLVPVAFIFDRLNGSLGFGVIRSAAYVSTGVILISIICLYNLKETFGKDLDYLEE